MTNEPGQIRNDQVLREGARFLAISCALFSHSYIIVRIVQLLRGGEMYINEGELNPAREIFRNIARKSRRKYL